MKKIPFFLLATSLIELILIVISFAHLNSAWLIISYLFWGIALPVIAFVFRDKKQLMFLFALLCVLIIIRISDQIDNNSLVGWFALVPLFVLAIAAFDILKDLYAKERSLFVSTFIRLVIGYDFATHTVEKLFAGPAVHNGMRSFFGPTVIGNFMNPDNISLFWTEVMIYWAGITEFTIIICLGMGFFTRFGAFLTIAYMLVASLLAHHFSAGYTWALPGWEFLLFWSLCAFPFLFKGTSGPLSLDYILRKKEDA